jgi:hypothetical protein
MFAMPKMSPTKKFPVSVEPDLHRQFKSLCVLRDVTMADAVRELLRRECDAAGVIAAKTKLGKSAVHTAI